jgi:hypothetical protein
MSIQVMLVPVLTLVDVGASAHNLKNQVQVLGIFSSIYTPQLWLLSQNQPNRIMVHHHSDKRKLVQK